MAHNVEKISIWILEAVEKEWRREPDPLKCRPASEILGPLKAEHGITDSQIDHAIHFMCSERRQYLSIIMRGDGKVILPSDNGLAILGTIELHRLEEQEKKKWSRADKIALASFILSVVSFFAGIHVGEESAKKSDNLPVLLPMTNSAAASKPQ